MTEHDRSDEARQAILQCQQRFWRALEHKDADLFAQVVAEDFLCRSPGQEDQDRTAFIAALTSITVTILNISGEAIAIRLVGDVALLTGTQVAQMRCRMERSSLNGSRSRMSFNEPDLCGK